MNKFLFYQLREVYSERDLTNVKYKFSNVLGSFKFDYVRVMNPKCLKGLFEIFSVWLLKHYL